MTSLIEKIHLAGSKQRDVLTKVTRLYHAGIRVGEEIFVSYRHVQEVSEQYFANPFSEEIVDRYIRVMDIFKAQLNGYAH
jgi:hypothetical protein